MGLFGGLGVLSRYITGIGSAVIKFNDVLVYKSIHISISKGITFAVSNAGNMQDFC